MGEQLGEVLLVAVLIVVNGVFAAAEIALVSARRSHLQAEADAGSLAARRVLRLTEDPSRFLAAIQVAITLVGFGASATAAVSLAVPVAEALRALGVPWVTELAGGLAVLLVTLVVAYVTLVAGELAPKRLGLQRAERVAKALAGPVSFVATVTAPLIWLLARSTDAFARLLGVAPGVGRPGVTEEEIKLLVTEQGTLLDEEKRMIHEILELGDTVAKEIMVPRVDMRMIEDAATVRTAIGIFQRSGFSRLPVFRDDADTIVGIVLLKDLVGPASTGRLDEPVAQHLRPAVFVPETKPILAMLRDMQAARNHVAIVVDEYGGTAGLVTIEDIVEEVIGEVADEFDRERRHITRIGESEWVVDGVLAVDEANESLGVKLPLSDEYETVAGWVLMELGHIPTEGEVVRREGVEVRVEAVRRRRIARLRVTVSGEARQAPDAHADEDAAR